jgi:predicted RNA-binding protein
MTHSVTEERLGNFVESSGTQKQYDILYNINIKTSFYKLFPVPVKTSEMEVVESFINFKKYFPG